MNTYKIQANFTLTTPLVFVAVLSAAWLILNLLPIPLEGQLEPEWINPVLAAVLLVPSSFLVYKSNHCNLVLSEGGLVYTPTFGKARNLTYSDIQKVTMGGKTYCIYTTDGKALIRFDDTHTTHSSEIVAFLKSKGVKAEM